MLLIPHLAVSPPMYTPSVHSFHLSTKSQSAFASKPIFLNVMYLCCLRYDHWNQKELCLVLSINQSIFICIAHIHKSQFVS